jgi:hypothetical protein
VGGPHLDAFDPPALDLLVEVVAEGLDLGQLGHGLLRRTPTPERCIPGQDARV